MLDVHDWKVLFGAGLMSQLGLRIVVPGLSILYMPFRTVQHSVTRVTEIPLTNCDLSVRSVKTDMGYLSKSSSRNGYSAAATNVHLAVSNAQFDSFGPRVIVIIVRRLVSRRGKGMSTCRLVSLNGKR